MELGRLVRYRPITCFIKRGKVNDMVAVKGPPRFFKPAEGLVLARQVHRFRPKPDHVAATSEAPTNTVDQRPANETSGTRNDHVLQNISYDFEANRLVRAVIAIK